MNTTKYIISDSENEGGQEKDVALVAELSVQIVTKTPVRCSVETEGGLGKENGVSLLLDGNSLWS